MQTVPGDGDALRVLVELVVRVEVVEALVEVVEALVEVVEALVEVVEVVEALVEVVEALVEEDEVLVENVDDEDDTTPSPNTGPRFPESGQPSS